MPFFTITSDAEFSGATVIFDDGSTHTIGSDNPNYTQVVRELLSGEAAEDELLDLIAPFEAVYKTLTKLSERVSRKGSKLLFDGDVVNSALSNFIIALMNEGKEESWKAYIAFMEKLYTNPSEESREHLFHFIESNGLQITPDGDLVLYKSTKEDGSSTYRGYGIVNGVEFENDYLINSVGAVVEIPRSRVDANRGVACSVGLHVGAFSYANTYSKRLWTTIVNPRDVVSVPSDHSDAKIRVARYQIVEENPKRIKYDGLVKSFETPVSSGEPGVVEAKTEPLFTGVNIFNNGSIDTSKLSNKWPDGSRVPEYIKLIQSGGAGKNLRKYRNKSVTAGRRTEFDQAVQALGLQY